MGDYSKAKKEEHQALIRRKVAVSAPFGNTLATLKKDIIKV